MNLRDFNDADQRVILECVRAAAAGPFFPVWEFYALFGLEHEELADMRSARCPWTTAGPTSRSRLAGR